MNAMLLQRAGDGGVGDVRRVGESRVEVRPLTLGEGCVGAGDGTLWAAAACRLFGVDVVQEAHC